ncbi:MAG: hypothetical protein ACR2RE_22760 [Geminicoccaceae bacterium]
MNQDELDRIIDQTEGPGFSRTNRELVEAKQQLQEAYRVYAQARSRIEHLEREQCRIWSDKMRRWSTGGSLP